MVGRVAGPSSSRPRGPGAEEFASRHWATFAARDIEGQRGLGAEGRQGEAWIVARRHGRRDRAATRRSAGRQRETRTAGKGRVESGPSRFFKDGDLFEAIFAEARQGAVLVVPPVVRRRVAVRLM